MRSLTLLTTSRSRIASEQKQTDCNLCHRMFRIESLWLHSAQWIVQLPSLCVCVCHVIRNPKLIIIISFISWCDRYDLLIYTIRFLFFFSSLCFWSFISVFLVFFHRFCAISHCVERHLLNIRNIAIERELRKKSVRHCRWSQALILWGANWWIIAAKTKIIVAIGDGVINRVANHHSDMHSPCAGLRETQWTLRLTNANVCC